MPDISDLLRKKGTIEGLVALREDGELSQKEIQDRMGVANGTIQKRIDDLRSHELIEEDARLGDSGRPTKTYKLTSSGSKSAEKLREIIEG